MFSKLNPKKLSGAFCRVSVITKQIKLLLIYLVRWWQQSEAINISTLNGTTITFLYKTFKHYNLFGFLLKYRRQRDGQDCLFVYK